MSDVELSEAYFSKIAGWEAVKQGKSLLESGHVLSSNWSPPVLKGVVQEGSASYRSGLVIKGSIEIENLCGCRASRQWGTICAHSVAVGLHHLRRQRLADEPPPSPSAKGFKNPASASKAEKEKKPVQRIARAVEGEGTEAELHVVFPPNFAQAASKGRIMVVFECEREGKRMPLNAVPKNQPLVFSSADLTLLDTIEELADGESAGMIMLSAGEFSKLLGALTDHPRVTLGKRQEMRITSAPWPLSIEAALEANGEITMKLSGSREFPPLIVGDKIWVIDGDRIAPLGLPSACSALFQGAMRVSRDQVPAFLNTVWPELQELSKVSANFDVGQFEFVPANPAIVLHLTGGLAHLQAELKCRYGDQLVSLSDKNEQGQLWMPDHAVPTRYSTRDPKAERAALSRLIRCGFAGPVDDGRYQLLGQNAVLNFFAKEYPRLTRQWEVTMEERLEKSAAKNIERVEPRFQITPSGEQWFDLSVEYVSGAGNRFSAADVQKLLLSGQSYSRSPSGRFVVMDTEGLEDFQEALRDASPQQREGSYRLHNAQAGYLHSTLTEKTGWTAKAPDEWRRNIAKQRGQEDLSPPPLGGLENVLRPYQKTGVGWMAFLRENGFGGILADEMGLGKTLQALAFLSSLRARGAKATGPSLVVCPTSLVFNWRDEAERFTPALKVLAMHGQRRLAMFGEIPHADLVVTSYALIRRDLDQYKQIDFDVVILDEAQHIKNRQTQNAQAVKAVRARQRLVLTGTPMENSVLDLWSIFDFLMPGYLSDAKEFRERYELPIAKEKSEEAQARLSRRIRPFLLRRLKRDVAKDLPARIDQVSFCELTQAQKELYQQVLEASRSEILQAVGANGVEKSRMMIFKALLRLRQICCDLRLLNVDNLDPQEMSGKFELFNELLEETLDGGHRVLVFSQFVTMLKLIGKRLESEEIDYCYLDGSTVDRGAVVKRFQTTETPVFLISLKAGGVGLNLTGADTVVHFDPWWNPAVEQQATDRAHRIGQTRVVTSYKLITRGTVEEKILNLQNRKRELIESTLGGEEAFASALNWDEIQDLLSE